MAATKAPSPPSAFSQETNYLREIKHESDGNCQILRQGGREKTNEKIIVEQEQFGSDSREHKSSLDDNVVCERLRIKAPDVKFR